MTIHITPERSCSYVSFESNVPVSSYDEVLARVLGAFRPGRFVLTVFATPVPNLFAFGGSMFCLALTTWFHLAGIGGNTERLPIGALVGKRTPPPVGICGSCLKFCTPVCILVI